MRYIYITLFAIFAVVMIILYGFVTSASNYGIPLSTTDEYISIFLEMINMIFGLLAIVVIMGSIQKFQGSTFGHILLYFTFGTFLLTLIRLFLMLNEVAILPLSDETSTMGWHIIFYCAAICFLGGMQKLYRYTKDNNSQVNSRNASILGMILTGLGITVLATSHLYDNTYVKLLRFNNLYILGLHHFIAFLFAGFIAVYLWKAKKQSPKFTLIINSFLWAFIFLSLVHVWELLTESWHVIPLGSDLIEHIEQLITLPGYILIVRAYMQKIPSEKDHI